VVSKPCAGGHAKTPDIKLELPIAVNGRIVNWIDSKASFCDPLVHVAGRHKLKLPS
jgi:hypothetical protein